MAVGYLAAGLLGCKPSNQIELVKSNDGLFMEYQDRVFAVEYKSPPNGRGIEYLVRISNPSFDDSEVIEARNLSFQLMDNPVLKNLQNKQIQTIDYDPARVTRYLNKDVYPGKSYPIPRKLEARSLNDILQNPK